MMGFGKYLGSDMIDSGVAYLVDELKNGNDSILVKGSFTSYQSHVDDLANVSAGADSLRSAGFSVVGDRTFIDEGAGDAVSLSETDDADLIGYYNAIAAAGNDAGRTNYPARLDEVIAIAAIDENGDLAHFTSGDETVDAVAPGVNIYSTFLNNSYAKMSGTSQACPFVAGLCALILAHNRMNPDVPRINNYIDMMKAIDLVSDDSRYINTPGQKKWGFGAPKVGNIDWHSI